jgi:hypothetical protein
MAYQGEVVCTISVSKVCGLTAVRRCYSEGGGDLCQVVVGEVM